MKKGSKLSQLQLWPGPMGLTPPTPPYGQPDHKIIVFLRLVLADRDKDKNTDKDHLVIGLVTTFRDYFGIIWRSLGDYFGTTDEPF